MVQFVGHVSGPKGPQSTLTKYQTVNRPKFDLWVMSARDAVTDDQWAQIWEGAEQAGYGALRSQGFGKFDCWGWDKVPFEDVPEEIRDSRPPVEHDFDGEEVVEEAERLIRI